MNTVLVQRKFSIYSTFLDVTLQIESEVNPGEDHQQALIRLHKELEETAAELRRMAGAGREDDAMNISRAGMSNEPSAPPVIDYRKSEQFEIDIDNAKTSEELEYLIKCVGTFPARLLSTINAKRQQLKPIPK